MASGTGLIERARQHIGEEYQNVTVPKNDQNWRGPWDCAEFMSWLVFQEAGVLYGCTDNSDDPGKAEAYTGAWQKDSEKLGSRISVQQAASTVGAILLRYPPKRGKMGHIALSDGRGGTIEAKGKAFGVVADVVNGRRWDTGVLVPRIDYGLVNAPLEVAGPSQLYGLNLPNMSEAVVSHIQRALAAKGFDPGQIDGKFGRKTQDAVLAFQEAFGLVVDGEVGKATADALGIVLSPITQALSKAVEETMNPLIAIAVSVLPDVVRVLAGDKAGSLTSVVTKAVTDATGTSDPAEARKKMAADPLIATDLQLKLAQIVADQEEKKRQAELALIKAQFDEQEKVRQAQLDQLKLSIADVANARSTFAGLAEARSPMAWGAPLVSVIITGGFFFILWYLISERSSGNSLQQNSPVFQIVNIAVGALAAAFATVVSFWLGSSQGSRVKDVTTFEMQAQQAQQAAVAVRESQQTQVKLAEAQASQTRVLQESISSENGPNLRQKASNFSRAVDIVLAYEGGYVDHPDDSGGPTNLGITLATLTRWRQTDPGVESITAEDVRKLGRDEACEIYRTNYWNVLNCDQLPTGVDLIVFDFGVNAGPSRSAKLLQKIVGVTEDGSVGPITLSATAATDPRKLIHRFAEDRLKYYQALDNWPTFGTGWTNRTKGIQQAALDMLDKG